MQQPNVSREADDRPEDYQVGQRHLITVKLVNHRDATLRYRRGYKYDKDQATIRERFNRGIWQPDDLNEISIGTKFLVDAAGRALRVTVAGTDLDLTEQKSLRTGKLDIFMVQRDDEGQHAKVMGQTVGLRLKPETYQRALSQGITFDERLDSHISPG